MASQLSDDYAGRLIPQIRQQSFVSVPCLIWLKSNGSYRSVPRAKMIGVRFGRIVVMLSHFALGWRRLQLSRDTLGFCKQLSVRKVSSPRPIRC